MESNEKDVTPAESPEPVSPEEMEARKAAVERAQFKLKELEGFGDTDVVEAEYEYPTGEPKTMKHTHTVENLRMAIESFIYQAQNWNLKLDREKVFLPKSVTLAPPGTNAEFSTPPEK